MQELLQQQRADGFSAFAGADITVRLPVRQSVLNEWIQVSLAAPGASGPVRQVAVEFTGGNRLKARITVDLLFLRQTIEIAGVVAPTIDFSADPRLLILLEPTGLRASAALAVVGSMENLRPFLTIADRRLFVDLGVLLAKSEAADLAPLIRTIRFATDDQVLRIELKLTR